MLDVDNDSLPLSDNSSLEQWTNDDDLELTCGTHGICRKHPAYGIK
jgi:hypothetical protein